MIGIVLKHTDNAYVSNIENVLRKKNSISEIISKYLLYHIIMNVLLTVVVYIINLILSEYSLTY